MVKSKKRRLLIWILTVGVVFIIGFYVHKQMNQLHPLSASGMTVDDRNHNDSRILEEALFDTNQVKSVEIDYDRKVIKIYSNIYRDETRREHWAKYLQGDTKKALIKNTEKLTIDDYYTVEVYSKDGDIIKVED